MDAKTYVGVARYMNGRGVRMAKCASAVDSCAHKHGFELLAAKYFQLAKQEMRMARGWACRRLVYRFEIIDEVDRAWPWSDVMAVVNAHDELAAGEAYEAQCESLGVNPGPYKVRLVRRVRQVIMIAGKLL